MKKKSKKLNLNKLVISKLHNSNYIQGGGSEYCNPTKSKDTDTDCPTTSLTCPESEHFTCWPEGTEPPISGIGC